jgi:alkylhydroperoxidase/carboxymuconolactone decarboxylase family protein YurZ
MRLFKHSLLSLAALNGSTDAFLSGDINTSMLLSWQILNNGNDMTTNQSINPLMMAQLFGDNNSVSGDDDLQKMLLMHSFSNPDMKNWLPLIMDSDKPMTDKLLMMSFMRQQEGQGLSAMSEMMPLLLMNDGRGCKIDVGGTPKTCTCEKSKSDSILKIMLMTGGSFMQNSAQSNLFYLLFNDSNECTCAFDDGSGTDTCAETSGIDPLLMYMMMNSPMGNMQTPEFAPRSAGLNQLIMSQTMGLNQDYQWLMNVDNAEDRRELAKTNLLQMMNIPPAIINMLEKKRAGEIIKPADKFALLNYITGGVTDMPTEVTAMFINSKDAKRFYISAMLSTGQIPEVAGMLMMALEEGANTDDIKDVLVQVAAGQLNPEQFNIKGEPYVPELPVGVYPGQDLYFIHIHLLGDDTTPGMDTCRMHDLKNRIPCQRNMYGGRGPLNAEQCESSPYCCWNPLQITEEQARSLTNGEKGYDDIPWCYYNIFFVHHDKYRMKVARPVQVANKFWNKKYKADPANPGKFFVATGIDASGAPSYPPFSSTLTDDQLKEKNDKDVSNTAFANPAECPGLFKYGLKLSPLIYARANAKADGAFVDGADANNAAIEQLIHKRTDCGFPGIPKFQCVAIRGCCWDETPYDRHLGIPQCYNKIALIPESIFKIVDAPEDLRPTAGDCNSNFFKIPQLYFEREACNYGIDMYKYDGISEGLTPLDMPSAEDCQLKLGCCWEDDMEVMQKYPWLPRCYKRQRDSFGMEETDPLNIDFNDLVSRSADLDN